LSLEVLRSDFAVSLKSNKLFAVAKTISGQVKLYRCSADQRSCFIDHKSALSVGRGRCRVEKIILNENHLHALYYQYENKRYAISSAIIEKDTFSKVMVLRELAWDSIYTFALWDALNVKQETFIMLGWYNEPRDLSYHYAETYLVSEMCSVEPEFVTYVHSEHIRSISIQTVFVPKGHRPLTEREMNGVMRPPQILAATRYLESLAGIEPPAVYKTGYDTMEAKLRYHVDFAKRMRKVHKLRTLRLYTPIRTICEYAILFSLITVI
uniref:CNH domain-containing protein n=1 Tax=Toxocara canis TaxID=6265 RepID=A0A183VD52_TOXCA